MTRFFEDFMTCGAGVARTVAPITPIHGGGPKYRASQEAAGVRHG